MGGCFVESASQYLFPEFPTRLESVKDRLESSGAMYRGWLRSSYPTGAGKQKTDCCKQNGPYAWGGVSRTMHPDWAVCGNGFSSGWAREVAKY